MIRTASLTALGLLACATGFGASRPESSTYVDGNVSTLKPHTGGSLVFSDSKAILFRTGLAEVSVPYAGIRKAELGVTQTHSSNQPAYKVWTLPQRLKKQETQLLTIEYKNGKGEDQTMTLELAKLAASNVIAEIQEHVLTARGVTPASGNAGEQWWGDSYWKTPRNQDRWSQGGASGAK